MPKPTPKYRSAAGVLADVNLRRRANEFAAVSKKLPLEHKRYQRAWNRLLGAAVGAAKARVAEVRA